MTTTSETALRRRLAKVLRDLRQVRDGAKEAAERAGDNRGGKDRCWWWGNAAGLGDAAERIEAVLARPAKRRAKR